MAWFIWCNQTDTTSTYTNNQYTQYTNQTGCVWPIWAGGTTITNTSPTANNMIWVAWVGDSTPQLVQFAAQSPLPAQQLTPEEAARMLQAGEASARRAAERERERQAAHVKAMDLLRANLTQKQRDDLDKRNWFLVEGGKSKKTYRISGKSYAGNITELAGDREVARYCVHAEWQIPLGDQLLAQALYLRLDEDYILGRANRTTLLAA